MKRLLFLCTGLLVASCGSLPQTHFYRLSAAALEPAREPVAGAVTIETLDADAGYSDDAIVYRTSPNKVDYYGYQRWTSPPAIQLTDYLRDAFERTGLFRQVQSSPSQSTQAVLGGRLITFDEVDVSETQWEGRLELQLELTDPASGLTLWSHRYAESEPIAQRSPEGLAIALSAAMQRIVRASAVEVANSLRARRASSGSVDAAAAEKP